LFDTQWSGHDVDLLYLPWDKAQLWIRFRPHYS
jgi:hypothetical protein